GSTSADAHWSGSPYARPAYGKEVSMRTQHVRPLSRRRFLGGLTLAGTVGLLGLRPRLVTAEPLPEMTRIRLVHDPSICVTPQYLAEDLLRADGFSEVQYVEATDGFGHKVVGGGGA